MTHMPPPPNVQYQQVYRPPASGTNAWAIVSLICGILGCFVVTPFAAIITGIIGLVTAGRVRSGRGMAIAGILLGLIWIGAVGGGIMLVPRFVGWASEKIVHDAKPQAINFLNDLADGRLDSARPHVDGISDAQLQSLSDKLKPLGHCQDIKTNSASVDSSNGRILFVFSGEGQFDRGTQPISVRMRQTGTEVIFEEVELR